MSTPLFHKGHYNILAAQIRRNFPNPKNYGDARGEYIASCEAVTALALSLAKRLFEDNENFDVPKFLDMCSPDPEAIPLSELWEGYNSDNE